MLKYWCGRGKVARGFRCYRIALLLISSCATGKVATQRFLLSFILVVLELG